MRHSPRQRAALKHALTKPRRIFPEPATSTPERLFTLLGIFALGVFFGWLLAGCPT